jgi:ribosomal-protein-alanine N-acetyltransferase
MRLRRGFRPCGRLSVRHKPLAAEILTRRLRLRRPTLADLDAIHTVHAALETNQFNPAGPMVSRAAAEVTLATWSAHWDAHGFGYWAAIPLQKNEIAGFGGIVRRDLAGRQTLNLYFRFAAAAWGKGYASELADAALRLAFEGLGADEVVGVTRENNEPSIRVLSRLGMILSGAIENTDGAPRSLVYALTAADWRPVDASVHS